MKTKRQAKILEIVASRDVETQEQLLEALQDAGFYSTQATISRDIKELRIVKELTKFGTYRYRTPSKEVSGTFSGRLNAIFKECVTGYDYAQNLVVVHTIPGLADAAASAVDSMSLPFVLGTIGGDDTVLIILRDSNAAAAFCTEIKNLIG
jgi:transcriptional regulator of arginine metabolism